MIGVGSTVLKLAWGPGAEPLQLTVVALGSPLLGMFVVLGSLLAMGAGGGIAVRGNLSVLAAGPVEGHTYKNIDCLEHIA